MVLRSADKIEGGLPQGLKIQMLFWIFVDFVVGLVPFVGDLLDAMVRANTKIAILLEAHLREQGIKNLKASGLPVPEVDPSRPDDFDRYDASISGASESTRTTTTASQPRRQGDMNSSAPQQPSEARVRDDGRGSRRARPDDVEQGFSRKASTRRH